jgi:hypothetical protein
MKLEQYDFEEGTRKKKNAMNKDDCEANRVIEI